MKSSEIPTSAPVKNKKPNNKRRLYVRMKRHCSYLTWEMSDLADISKV